MPPSRVIVVGDVFDDIIVTPHGPVRPDTDTGASIERRDGGSAANAAAWFAALGHEVHFFGRVGTDDAPRHSDSLERAGVTPHLVGEAELPTGTIVVVLEPDRTRTMLTERGANARTSPDDVDRSLLGRDAHLHLTAYTLFPAADGDEEPDRRRASFAGLIGAALQSGATVSVNPGSAGFIADHGAGSLLAATTGATVAVPNLDEGRLLTGLQEPDEVASALLGHYGIVALTLGRGGATATARSGATARVDAIPVTPVDTTGAGDAFGSAFVSSLLLSAGPDDLRPEAVTAAQLEVALDAAAAHAAEVIQRLGARPAPRVPAGEAA